MKHEGLSLGHDMAQIAADKAGEGWKEQAYAVFVNYAKNHETFTTEEVRQSANDLGSPPDARAWGQVALRAKREGVVQAVGWVRANSKSVHGMVVTQWKANAGHFGGSLSE